MENSFSKLHGIIQQIEDKHKAVIERGVREGKTPHLERLWHDTVNQRWNIKSFAFTDREKGNMKLFVKEFGDESGSIILDAINGWREMRRSNSLGLIAELPEFGSFFSFRKKIYVWIKARERDIDKRAGALANTRHSDRSYTDQKRHAKTQEPSNIPRLSLVEMAKAERKRIKEARELTESILVKE